MNVLRYQHSDRHRCLVDVDGNSVWPVVDETDFSVLQTAAELHGFPLARTPARECTASANTRPNLVVGFLLADPGPAQLYAHLTGRRCELVNDLMSLRMLDDVDVVLLRADSLTLEFLECLYDERTRSPGILFARDDGELYKVAKKFAVAACEAMSLRKRRLVAAGDFHFELLEPHSVEIIRDAPDHSSRAAVQGALEATNDLLILAAHSDGIDAYFASKLLLCPFRIEDMYRAGKKPLCLQLGRCIRHPDLPSLTEAYGSRPILHVAALRAKMLLLSACNAVRVADGVLDPAFSLASSIVEGANVGCVVTSWSQMDASLHWVAFVLAELAVGRDIGSIVSQLNYTRDGAVTRFGLCIIGDPAVSATDRDLVKPAHAVPASRASQSWRVPCVRGRDRVQADFMALALRWGLNHNIYCDEEPGLRLLEALSAGLPTTDDGSLTLRGAQQDDALAFFSSVFNINDAWDLMTQELRYISRDTRCPLCGGRSQLFRHRFELSPLADRYSLFCARCGLVINSPLGYAPAIDAASIGGPALRLINVPAGSRAIVNYISRHFPFTRNYQWPRDSHTGLAREFRHPPDSELPQGPLQLRIILSWNLNIATVATKFRGDGA